MADLASFILEQDLYKRPVALVGIGLGAAVALAAASQYPRLVGALVLIGLSLATDLADLSFSPFQAAAFRGELASLLVCKVVNSEPACCTLGIQNGPQLDIGLSIAQGAQRD